MGNAMRPVDLVLRCYGYRDRAGKWYGVCLDLNLAAQADSQQELVDKLNLIIRSYVESVLDTEDQESIPALLRRRAPLSDWVRYYLYKALVFIRRFPDNFTFQEHIPFHLAHSC